MFYIGIVKRIGRVMFETFPKGGLVTFTFAAHFFTKSIFLYCVPTCYLSPCSVCLHWIIRGAHIQMSFIAICFTLYTVGPSSWWLQSYTAPSSPPTQHHDSLSNIYIIIIGNQSQSDSQIAIQQCIFGSFARCFLGSLRSFCQVRSTPPLTALRNRFSASLSPIARGSSTPWLSPIELKCFQI